MGKIVVTGIGIISSLGDSADANRRALRSRAGGISHLQMFPTKYSDSRYFGEVKIDNIQLKESLEVNEKGVTRTTLLALHAMKEALADSNMGTGQLASYDTALIGANTVGGMCLTDEMYRDANSQYNPSEYIASYDLGSVNLYLQRRFGIKGIVNTINTACSSSANSIMYGANLIRCGYAKRAIVGGVDSIAKFTINGFNSLQILSPEICKPFDQNRQGLNLGEGAAFLILEKEEDAKGKKVYAELSGYHNSNDAFHPSSISEEGTGPYLAMTGALQVAGLASSEIDYINAHGTGTENNDAAESRAMVKLFENEVPAFASTKSFTGHTLGGAGAMEAVYSIFCIFHQEMYPSLNFETPIEDIGLKPLREFRKAEVNHVLSNSFGFGGNCSSLIFSRV